MLDFVPNHMAPDHPWVEHLRLILVAMIGVLISLNAVGVGWQPNKRRGRTADKKRNRA
jgi:hypothetical protein